MRPQDHLRPLDGAARADDGRAPAREIVAVSEVVAQIVRVVARDGSTLDLWDDVPTHRLLYGVRLLDLAVRQEQAARDGDAEAFEALSDERDRETLSMTSVIVRHSYPNLTSADVRRLLAPDTQEAIINHFFTRRLMPYLQQQRALRESALGTPASPDSSAASESTTMAEPTTMVETAAE